MGQLRVVMGEAPSLCRLAVSGRFLPAFLAFRSYEGPTYEVELNHIGDTLLKRSVS